MKGVVPLLAYARSTQPHGLVRRGLTILCCVLWADLCVHRWPAHVYLLRILAALAAEADGLVPSFAHGEGVFLALLTFYLFYGAAYGLAFFGLDAEVWHAARCLVTFLGAACGYAAGLLATNERTQRAAATVEGACLSLLATQLGL